MITEVDFWTWDKIAMTMIYTGQDINHLYEKAVERKIETIEAHEGKQIELSQDEKDRIWKLIVDSCK